MKISSVKKVSFRRAILPASIIAAMAMSGSASAFKVETGNPDLDVRWDNTFRYNAGWRMQDPSWYLITPGAAGVNPGAAGSATSDKKFKNGGMVTNRLDILSEFDFIYKIDTGFRVSAAGWYDPRYGNHKQANGNFVNDDVPAEIQRYYNGPSGEFLDAFVFTKFKFGEVPVNVRLGQHTIYWGETLFSLADGVSVGQSYADLRKAIATPGVEAKEVFRPLDQFSFSAQMSTEFTVMGQYFFDYKNDLFPLGGTYFSPVDFLTYHGQTTAIPLCAFAPAVPCSASFPAVVWDGLHYNGLKKSGDWGLGAKWRPEWLDGTAGFYYREFTSKINGGALVVNLGGLGGSILSGGAAPAVAGLWFDPDAPRAKLMGFSLAKQVFGISWGLDLNYIKDAELAAKPFTFINGDPLLGALGPSGTNGLTGWAPIGDVYTGTFNMIAYDGKRDIFGLPLYDSAVFTVEFDYDTINKVTKNPQNFNGKANCVNGTSILSASGVGQSQGYYGCATNNSYGINISIEPKWFQVWSGTDVTLPLFFSQGLHGNSYSAVGQNEGQGVYSVGIAADVDSKYNFKLQYNGQLYKHHTNSIGVTNAALGDFSDRNWLSFTAKATW